MSILHSIKLGLITNKQGHLAKSFTRDGDEVKSAAAANLWDGEFENIFIKDLSELPDVIDSTKPNQALTLGYAPTALNGKVGICTKRNPRAGAIPRDHEHIVANEGEQIGMLDYDGEKISFDEMRALAIKAIPALANCEMFLIESSSAGVRLAEATNAESGKHGIHGYFKLSRGADMSMFRDLLELRSWQQGLGEIKLSSRGAMLERCPFDLCVFDVARLVFEARPLVGEGLVLVSRKSAYYPGTALDVQLLAKPNTLETKLVEDLKSAAKVVKESESEALRSIYRNNNYVELKTKGIPDRIAWHASRRLEAHEIHATDTVRVLV